MQISDFLEPGNVVLGLSASSKDQLLQQLAGRAARSLGLDEAAIFAALANREALGSTGMGLGMAIPHATLPGIGSPFGLLARLNRPIEFDAVDEAPVDVVFLLLNPAVGSPAALGPLSCIARALRDPEIARAVRTSDDPRKLYERIATGVRC